MVHIRAEGLPMRLEAKQKSIQNYSTGITVNNS